MTQVNAEELAKLAYNAYQFVNPKSIYLPGEILFMVDKNALRVYACDDYIAYTETIPTVDSSDPFQFVMALADTKELEKFARENKKYALEIEKEEQINFVARGETETRFFADLGEERNETWDIVDALLFETCDRETPGDYYTRPERVANLSKLKVPKEAPIGWRHVNLNGTHLIRFRLGTTSNGVIKPVDPSDIQAEYLWEDNA